MIDADLKYLKEALGLDAVAGKWPEVGSLPLYLKSGADIDLVEAVGTSFLLVWPCEEVTLPDIKRLHAQLSKRADIPVAVSVPTADARQRKALVSQGVPFVCAGRQVSLPFLGVATTEWGKKKLEAKQKEKLTPKAQQAAIWGSIRNQSYSLAELRNATGMSASQASSAVGELVAKGLANRTKRGRETIVVPVGKKELLDEYMSCLSSPVLQVMCVESSSLVEVLPDAGESALASRSMLSSPSVRQKAVSRAAAKSLTWTEVLQGELPDSETMQVQIWKYDPLFAGADQVDDVSLALSLVNTGNERVSSEIDSLFGGEYLWQKVL